MPIRLTVSVYKQRLQNNNNELYQEHIMLQYLNIDIKHYIYSQLVTNGYAQLKYIHV